MNDFDINIEYSDYIDGEIFENEHVWMWIHNQIHFVVYKPGCVMTLDVAKEIVKDRLAMVDGVSYPGFGDIRNLKSINRDAMKYNKTEESAKFVSAGALFLNNQLLKILSNIFLSLGKTLVPAKSFTDKEKAIQWLHSLKSLN